MPRILVLWGDLKDSTPLGLVLVKLHLLIVYHPTVTDQRPYNFGRFVKINPLTPNDLYMSRTAPLTSKRCILYIYSTNVGTKYFKHALYSPFFSLQNAGCFIMLTCLVPVLFTFYIQCVLKLKRNNSGAKGLMFICKNF